MANIFNEEELLEEDNSSADLENPIKIEVDLNNLLGARKRLEDLLEQKKLKDELDDYAHL